VLYIINVVMRIQILDPTISLLPAVQLFRPTELALKRIRKIMECTRILKALLRIWIRQQKMEIQICKFFEPYNRFFICFKKIERAFCAWSSVRLMSSRSGVESATSEVSWEALEEGEARPTLWVPDHAVRYASSPPPPHSVLCTGTCSPKSSEMFKKLFFFNLYFSWRLFFPASFSPTYPFFLLFFGPVFYSTCPFSKGFGSVSALI
jgi:hypothetical protein